MNACPACSQAAFVSHSLLMAFVMGAMAAWMAPTFKSQRLMAALLLLSEAPLSGQRALVMLSELRWVWALAPALAAGLSVHLARRLAFKHASDASQGSSR